MTCSLLPSLCLCASAVSSASALAQTVAVYPPDINLETARDRQTFVVQATDADGLTRDVTAQAKIAFANPALVKLDGFIAHPARRRRRPR